MKIGDHVLECPNCKNRWFTKESAYALTENHMVIMEEIIYTCTKCKTQLPKIIKKG